LHCPALNTGVATDLEREITVRLEAGCSDHISNLARNGLDASRTVAKLGNALKTVKKADDDTICTLAVAVLSPLAASALPAARLALPPASNVKALPESSALALAD